MTLDQEHVPGRDRALRSVDELRPAPRRDEYELREVVRVFPGGEIVRMLGSRRRFDFVDCDRKRRILKVIGTKCFCRIFFHHGDIIPLFVEKFKEMAANPVIFIGGNRQQRRL